jgi:PTS system mannose-specific IIA component
MDAVRPAIGVVGAAHAPLASALCDTARRILADAALGDDLAFVEVSDHASAAEAFNDVAAAIRAADQGRGVLLLADLFGGSAANIALGCLGEAQVEVVTGVNLAMILEALSQRRAEPGASQIALRVAEAAQQSVVVASALLAPKSRPSRGAALEVTA